MDAPGEALYIGLEDSYRRIKNRVEARLRKAKGNNPIIPDRFYCETTFPALDKGGVQTLDDWLTQHPDCRLVVINVLQAIAPRASRNNNQYAADYAMLGDLHRLALARHIPILLVCHTTKTRHENVVDEINATTGLTGKVDTVIVLSRATPGQWVLNVTGRDVERQALALTFDPAIGTWALLGNAQDHVLSPEQRHIVEVLKEADEPMAPKDIADILEKSRGAIKYLMWKMGQAGTISPLGDGRYTTNHANHTNRANRTNQVTPFAVSGGSLTTQPLNIEENNDDF